MYYVFYILTQCIPSPVDNNILFGEKIGTKPGDMVDNDCDGLIDEEINNGKGKGKSFGVPS